MLGYAEGTLTAKEPWWVPDGKVSIWGPLKRSGSKSLSPPRRTVIVDDDVFV